MADDNPWTSTGRVFWRDDPEFSEFTTLLLGDKLPDTNTDSPYTYEQLIVFCGVDKWSWPSEDWRTRQNLWEAFTNGWKDDRQTEKLPLFSGIALLFAFLPYHCLENVGNYLTRFESTCINDVYVLETIYVVVPTYSLPFVLTRDICSIEFPFWPPAAKEIRDKIHNRSTWWIGYMVYEWKRGWPPIIDSSPAQWKSSR